MGIIADIRISLSVDNSLFIKLQVINKKKNDVRQASLEITEKQILYENASNKLFYEFCDRVQNSIKMWG